MLKYDIRIGVKKIKTKTEIAISGVGLATAGFAMAVAMPFAAHAVNGDNGPSSCANGKQIVNVNYTLVNDYDSGVAGNAWANDTINRHLQVWQAGSGMYCATVNDTGSFVTFTGASPSGSSTVSSGISGRINGGYNTTIFSGTLSTAPNYATKGNLGTFDLQCVDAYNCPGAHPTYASYFTTTSGDDLAVWGWTYHTPKNGDWVNASPGNSGDISS
jgi:hypothetical protein